MKLYLIRHGESEANLDYNLLKTKRDEDVELSPKGYQDALAAGFQLRKLLERDLAGNFDNVFFQCSPWTRTRQTWSVINAALGGKYEALNHHGIVEHQMNLVNNPKNWELFKQYEASGWNVREFMNSMYEGGESLKGVRNRAQLLLKEVKEYINTEVVVCVCHGQFIKQVVSLAKGIDPDKLVHPVNGEVVELDI